MEKKYMVKSGAIKKIVPEGSLKWYLAARYVNLGEVNYEKKATNTKKSTRK